jgi:pyruvate-formate lyase-activating enzyme
MSQLRRAVVRAEHSRRLRYLPELGGSTIFLTYPLRRAAAALSVMLLLGSVVLPAIFVTTGCATNATAQRKAYTSIADVAEGVNAAMKAFNALYQAGTVDEAARTKVLDAYKIYQKGALLAVSVGKDLGQDANALKIATDAAWPLLDLIATIKGGAK